MKRAFNDETVSNDGVEYDFRKSQNSLTMQAANNSGPDNSFSALDYSATSPDHSSTDSGSLVNARSSNYNRQSAIPNRNNYNSKSLDEEERKKIRRERNKMAAAKCRQKRVDQTNMLLEETQKLENQQKLLKEDIRNFEKQKEELEYIMESHLLHCQMKVNDNISNNTNLSNTSISSNNQPNTSSNFNQSYSISNNTALNNSLSNNNNENIFNNHSNIPNVNSIKNESQINGDINDLPKDLNNIPLILKSENGRQYLVTCNTQQQNQQLQLQLQNKLQQQQHLEQLQQQEKLKQIENFQQPISNTIHKPSTTKNEPNVKNEHQPFSQDNVVQMNSESTISLNNKTKVTMQNSINDPKNNQMTVIRPNQLPSMARLPLMYSNNNNVSSTIASLNTPCMTIGLDSLLENTGLTPLGDAPLFQQHKTSHVLITPIFSLPPDAMMLNHKNNNDSDNNNNNNNDNSNNINSNSNNDKSASVDADNDILNGSNSNVNAPMSKDTGPAALKSNLQNDNKPTQNVCAENNTKSTPSITINDEKIDGVLGGNEEKEERHNTAASTALDVASVRTGELNADVTAPSNDIKSEGDSQRDKALESNENNKNNNNSENNTDNNNNNKTNDNNNENA